MDIYVKFEVESDLLDENNKMMAAERKNNTLYNFVYAVLLMLAGIGVSYFNHQLFNGFGTLIWFTIFLTLSLCFSTLRNLIVRLLNFKPF